MKIGICNGKNNAELIINNGYDYIEENLTAIGNMTEADFENLVSFYKEKNISVYSTNCFFPGSATMYETDSLDKIREWVDKSVPRAARLGVKICVLGSGAARKFPENTPREEAEARFTEVVRIIAKKAKEFDIKIAIEPLSFKETNCVNFVSEAVYFAEKSGCDNVGALVDFFHFYMNGEKDDGLLCARGRLIHAHIARANPDRQMPTPEELPTVIKWANMLKEIGYDGNLSLEGGYGSDFEATIKTTLSVLSCFKEI